MDELKRYLQGRIETLSGADTWREGEMDSYDEGTIDGKIDAFREVLHFIASLERR